MERWEGYLLGAFGLALALGSIGVQIAAFAADRTGLALAATLGVLGGALLYRTGYRGIAR
jgi:hypothetical protein